MVNLNTELAKQLYLRMRLIRRFEETVVKLVDDNEIVVYDNLHRNALQFAHLSEHKHLHFIKGDVLDYEATSKAMVSADSLEMDKWNTELAKQVLPCPLVPVFFFILFIMNQ